MFSSSKIKSNVFLRRLVPTIFNQYHDIHSSINLELLAAQSYLIISCKKDIAIVECFWGPGLRLQYNINNTLSTKVVDFTLKRSTLLDHL